VGASSAAKRTVRRMVSTALSKATAANQSDGSSKSRDDVLGVSDNGRSIEQRRNRPGRRRRRIARDQHSLHRAGMRGSILTNQNRAWPVRRTARFLQSVLEADLLPSVCRKIARDALEATFRLRFWTIATSSTWTWCGTGRLCSIGML